MSALRERIPRHKTLTIRDNVVWKAMIPAVIIALAYTSVMSVRSTLGFPFLRTIVRCEHPTPSDFDRSDKDWSGSAYCNDTRTVLATAQLYRGFASGTDLTIQCITLPAAGHLADSLGRRPMANWSLLMFLVASLFFLGGAVWEDFATYYVGFITQSFGGVLGIMTATMSADVFPSPDQRGAVIGFATGLGVLLSVLGTVIVNVLVIAENPVSYVVPASVLFLISIVLLGSSFLVWPETMSVDEVPMGCVCCLPRLPRSVSLARRRTMAAARETHDCAVPALVCAYATACHWRAGQDGDDNSLQNDGDTVELVIREQAERYARPKATDPDEDDSIPHVASSPRVYGSVTRDPALAAAEQDSGNHRWVRARTWQWRYLIPCHGCGIFCEDRLVGLVGLLLGIFMLAGSSLTILQAFVNQEYEWSNADATWGGVATLVIFLLAISAGPCVTKYIGPLRALQLGIGFVAVGMLVLTVAAIHPAVGMTAVIIIASGGFCVAPLGVFLTRIVPRERQGQFQTVLNSLALGVAAPAAIGYSYLFANFLPVGGVLSIPFSIGAFFFLIALVCGFYINTQFRTRIEQALGQDDEDEDHHHHIPSQPKPTDSEFSEQITSPTSSPTPEKPVAEQELTNAV